MTMPFASRSLNLDRRPPPPIDGQQVCVRRHLTGIQPNRMPPVFDQLLLDLKFPKKAGVFCHRYTQSSPEQPQDKQRPEADTWVN